MIITGAVYISQLLNVTRTLQKLDMTQNDISDDGMAVISEALLHNKSLTRLWVDKCGLSVKGIIVCVYKMYLLMHKNIFKHLDLQNLQNLNSHHSKFSDFRESNNLCVLCFVVRNME